MPRVRTARGLPGRIALLASAALALTLPVPAAASLAPHRLQGGGGGGFWTRARVRRALAGDPPSHRPPNPGAAPVTASSLRVLEASAPQDRANGRVFGFYPGEGPYACSGTSLGTPSGSVVLTAGHCVVEDGVWATHVVFVPAFDHERRPFGTFAATQAYAMSGWRRGGNSDFDVGALRVRRNRLGTLSAAVGAKGWTSSRSRRSQFQIFGYPAAGALDGEELRSCSSPGLGADRNLISFGGPTTVPARCDMAAGSSGGAWLVDEGQLIDGVTSYGYSGVPNRLYSPYFGSQVASFIRGLP
jgi:Trypsin-like peptidase domain